MIFHDVWDDDRAQTKDSLGVFENHFVRCSVPGSFCRHDLVNLEFLLSRRHLVKESKKEEAPAEPMDVPGQLSRHWQPHSEIQKFQKKRRIQNAKNQNIGVWWHCGVMFRNDARVLTRSLCKGWNRRLRFWQFGDTMKKRNAFGFVAPACWMMLIALLQVSALLFRFSQQINYGHIDRALA